MYIVIPAKAGITMSFLLRLCEKLIKIVVRDYDQQ